MIPAADITAWGLRRPWPTRAAIEQDLLLARTSGPIGSVLDALREVAVEAELEINTYERSPARPLIRHPFRVSNSWFTGMGEVLTFCPEELVATKLRALYQRKKGRDLFDLWLAITELELKPAEIIECFAPYRPAGYTSRLAVTNLLEKVNDKAFNSDLIPLVAQWPAEYNVPDAAELIIESLLSHIDSPRSL